MPNLCVVVLELPVLAILMECIGSDEVVVVDIPKLVLIDPEESVICC